MSAENPNQILATGEATGFVPAPGDKGKPITVIGTGAIRELDQKTVDDEFVAHDVLTNCRTYPKDEAPAAYQDFNEVLSSVRLAGLASEVARLRARFVIKDSDDSLKGAA